MYELTIDERWLVWNIIYDTHNLLYGSISNELFFDWELDENN